MFLHNRIFIAFIRRVVKKWEQNYITKLHSKITVSGQLPTRKIVPRLGLGFGLGLALELGLRAIFLGAIVLEPKIT